MVSDFKIKIDNVYIDNQFLVIYGRVLKDKYKGLFLEDDKENRYEVEYTIPLL